jgi:hypothetical protein
MGPDTPLLIHVSNLSGGLQQDHGPRDGSFAPMFLPRRSPQLLTTLVAASLLLGPAQAGPRDHDAVRQAVERGEIRALSDILSALRGKLPGEVTGVEIEHKNGRWLYEFRVVDSKGRLFDIYVDARTAEIARIKEK